MWVWSLPAPCFSQNRDCSLTYFTAANVPNYPGCLLQGQVHAGRAENKAWPRGRVAAAGHVLTAAGEGPGWLLDL